jgi:hypothetical protein
MVEMICSVCSKSTFLQSQLGMLHLKQRWKLNPYQLKKAHFMLTMNGASGASLEIRFCFVIIMNGEMFCSTWKKKKKKMKSTELHKF